MRKRIHQIYHNVLVFLHLSPLSLAEKCRMAFGAAIVFVLILALSIPYVWMNQLTQKTVLDIARAKSDALYDQYVKLTKNGEIVSKKLITPGEIQWINLTKNTEEQFQQLTNAQKEMLELLRSEKTRDDNILLEKENGRAKRYYIRIFRTADSYKPIAAIIMQRPANEIKQTVLMNRVWIIVAGLIAGAGAIVAFYTITQRVILRPIRRLRALANNVADGNFDIRSEIKTGDEYEKLANAFNHMLDGIQQAQGKSRQTNIQLDAKISELSERNIELFKANKVKGEFLANISHEFRTPLNAILGFAEILREKPGGLDEEKTKKYAENIITGGNRLLNMINDLLEMAKTEAGKMKLHIDETSIPALCNAVVGSFAALTKKQKIKIRLTVDENIPTLYTDAGKIQQVLYNFLSNSIKFTPPKGKIEIRAEMPNEKTVRISVKDTGCGIAEADREKIFEKFRQVDGSITRKSTGSGLGLAICNELAAMLAGSIGLESESSKGSTFWLDIPVTRPENKEKTPEQKNKTA
ncbi:MAG: HAMP domain-containing histidine kinase [Planctomycetes bacterium]|nr:HAMP domain-containing histidine kinase [Planctomycetota bacterium]